MYTDDDSSPPPSSLPLSSEADDFCCQGSFFFFCCGDDEKIDCERLVTTSITCLLALTSCGVNETYFAKEISSVRNWAIVFGWML